MSSPLDASGEPSHDDGAPPLMAPHIFKLVHFPTLTWCKFCTKFIWGLGKQGYMCKACKYPCHTKCLSLVPSNCPKQEIKDPNTKQNIQRAKIENFNDLVAVMQDRTTGVEVKDRKFLVKTHKNCFVGQELVDWMLTNLPLRDREEAAQLGNKLIKLNFIKHVSDPNKPFKDGEAYYYFEDPKNIPAAAEAAETIEDEVGLDDFETHGVIGKGGFGIVMKCKKKGSDKMYAMKVMNKSKITGPRQLQCLIAEKNIMLNDNPFLVHLHYSFQTDDRLYFVMDYIPGGDLAYHLDQRGRFVEKEVRHIVAEIVLALEHLHSCGIVYRDLKLENILLDKDGHVCLTDFGLSKELESISATTKTVCGTPTYLAPEVLLSQPYGNSIDWWSLGVVMYELFTGMNPFDAKDFDTVLHNILHTTIIVPEYVPSQARDLMYKLLQRNPTKRMCSGPTGSAEIQNDPFFAPIDWKKLMVKAVKAPFVPPKDRPLDPELVDGQPPEGRADPKKMEFNSIPFTYVEKTLV